MERVTTACVWIYLDLLSAPAQDAEERWVVSTESHWLGASEVNWGLRHA